MQRLWWAFAGVLVASFAVLGWIGTRIYQEMPPVPDRVVTTADEEIIASGEIAKGQNVWQTLGGMEVGSVWGHGSYVRRLRTMHNFRRLITEPPSANPANTVRTRS